MAAFRRFCFSCCSSKCLVALASAFWARATASFICLVTSLAPLQFAVLGRDTALLSGGVASDVGDGSDPRRSGTPPPALLLLSSVLLHIVPCLLILKDWEGKKDADDATRLKSKSKSFD